MPAQAKLSLILSALLSGAVDIGAVTHAADYSPTYALGDGSGADQIAQVFADTRTIAASGSEDLDLNGTLVNAIGATVNFTKIKAIIIKAAAGNANDVVVGGAASNQFATPFGAAAHTVKVKPGGLFVLVAPDANGYAVTAATADLLKIANSGAGTGVTYDIVLLGV